MPTDATTLRLERELSYYRRETNDLGGKVMRLQEEQQRSFLDAQRSRLLVKMVRQLYGLSDRSGPGTLLPELVLGVVAENAICTCTALFREVQLGTGVFTLAGAVGLPHKSRSELLRMRRTPAFVFSTAESEPEPASLDLADFLGVPYILWAYDAPSGYAIVLGNRIETNVHRAFDLPDRELVETALTVFLDAQARVPQALASFEDDSAKEEEEPCGLEGGEALRQQFRPGSHIAGVLIVERPGVDACDYVAYLNVTWKRGWHVLRSWRNREDRTYRVLTLLLHMLRSDLEYAGPITIYAASDPELERIPTVAARERGIAGMVENRPPSKPSRSPKKLIKADA